MNTVRFKCDVAPDGYNDSMPALIFGINLDGITKYVSSINEAITVEFDVLDDELEHKIEFVMQGKTNNHTTIDNNGNILTDVVLHINNITIDNIDLSPIISSNPPLYKHDLNGNNSEIIDQFCSTMGCNGTVELNFTTPFYIWLLENM